MIWSPKDNQVEDFELENGKKIIRYVDRCIFKEGFCWSWKYTAKYYFEYIYDYDGNLISKKIKENPHYTPYESPYPDGCI